jgi:glyoxylase-like metal-dependent hydrolase (beta-lactamase superfamily II)
MKTVLLLATVGSALAVAGCSTPRETAATRVLQAAQRAIGNLGSIQISGTGMNAFFGQALAAGEEWPRRDLSSMIRTINYEQQSSLTELDFAQPTFGGQKQIAQLRGDKAWNFGPAGATAQPAAVDERQLQILLTPHGFVREALGAGNAILSGTPEAGVVSFTALGKFRLNATLDSQNLITKIETMRPDPLLGDMEVVATFSEYKNQSGVTFPAKILITEGGFPTWELNITGVVPNAPLDLPVPEQVQAAELPQTQVASAKLGEGVWHIAGGSHHSVVVEFADHLAVVEAPLSDERSLAVLAEAKRLAPNKEVRYVLTTHHHFDHVGGLRTYVGEGATIVTHQSNVPYLAKVLTAPSSLVPDTLSKNPKPPRFQPVADKHVLTDGNQRIEVYATSGDSHTKEYTLIYIPKARVLVEGDAYSPGPLDAPLPAIPPPNAVTLYREIQRLKLPVDTIAPIHGRGAVPISELKKLIGEKS